VLLGAAAAVVVAGAAGGTWAALDRGAGSAGVTAAGAQAALTSASEGVGQDSSGRSPQSLRGEVPEGSGQTPAPAPQAPSVPAARDTTRWFGTVSTPQTAAFDAVDQAVASRWPDVFSGAYAADPAGARVTVAVTRRDPGLESFVTGAMPSPSDVEFVVMSHSLAEKQKVAQEIVDQRMLWRSKGIEIIAVTQDARNDQVVVRADEGSAPGLIAAQYGDIVRVVPSSQTPPGKFPDGSTPPPLQR
jgi:hypothetical protein